MYRFIIATENIAILCCINFFPRPNLTVNMSSLLPPVSADDPPMAVVRKFVHLLDHSDQDFQEELELMQLREEVITNIRSNQQLENDLNLMDIKIGLLVKNKITLQEVVSHSKKLTKKNKGQLSDMMMMNKQRGGLKALSKEKRVKLEAYQYLFYLLQVTLQLQLCSLIALSLNPDTCRLPQGYSSGAGLQGGHGVAIAPLKYDCPSIRLATQNKKGIKYIKTI